MSCQEGRGFVSIRHSDLRDLTANMLSEVCKDIEIEPKLTTLTGKELDSRNVNAKNEVRLEIRARGIWERGNQAFFDLGLLTSIPHLKSLQESHVMKEQEKKRAYNERVLQIQLALLKRLPTVCRKVAEFDSDTVISEFISRI